MMPNSMGVEVMLVRLQCQPRTWPSVEGMSQLEWCTPSMVPLTTVMPDVWDVDGG